MKKLALNRESLRRLDDRILQRVQGGNDDTVEACFTIANTCQPVTIGPCVITSPCPGRTKKC